MSARNQCCLCLPWGYAMLQRDSCTALRCVGAPRASRPAALGAIPTATGVRRRLVRGVPPGVQQGLQEVDLQAG